MTEALETNEALLRADPHSGLGLLADQTGGFLIANSNDLRDGFGRIDTDMRNYYVLTYVPKNTNFDGKFRTIDVKVKRPGDARAARARATSRCNTAGRRAGARLRGAGARRARPARRCRTRSRCGRCRCASRSRTGPA